MSLPAARVHAHRRHRSLGSLDDTLPSFSRAERLTVITASCRDEGESSGDEGGIIEEKVVVPYVPLTAMPELGEGTRTAVQPSSLAARRAGTDAKKALSIKAAMGNYRSRQTSAEGQLLSPSIAVTPPGSAAVLNWTLPSPGLESPVTFANAHRRRLTEPLTAGQAKHHTSPPSLDQLVEWQRRRHRHPPSTASYFSTVIEESSPSSPEGDKPASPSITVEFHHDPTPIKMRPMPTNKGTQSVARAACARRLVSTLSRRAGGPPTIVVAA